MSLFGWLFGGGGGTVASQASAEAIAASEARRTDWAQALQSNTLPEATQTRLRESRGGAQPWTATMTASELLLARSHGVRPVATVSATCWLHYGYSWTEGHAQGWHTALRRLRTEAIAAGANAVLDVKMRTTRLAIRESMDFTLVGTAVRLEHLPASPEPVIATVPALEFMKLVEADIVPVGIAVGARYNWLPEQGLNLTGAWQGNIELRALSGFWEQIRRQAHADLRQNARAQGNGVLAHTHFRQLFRVERERAILGRHIVVATVVDTKSGGAVPMEIAPVVDLRNGNSPLAGRQSHHRAYATNDEDGEI